MTPYITIIGTNTFTLESVGYKGSKKGGYAVRATVNIAGNNEYTYLYYKSPASINSGSKPSN